MRFLPFTPRYILLTTAVTGASVLAGLAWHYPQHLHILFVPLTVFSALTALGWSQADMQLFSDERELARANPAKICQLVHDWFAAQLGIKDADVQLRLLVDSLRPVVAG